MTIHDYPGETNREPAAVDPSPQQRADESAVQEDQRAESYAPPAEADPAMDTGGTGVDDNSGSGSEPSTGALLFGDTELEELRREWANVQAGFVDDPKRCVEEADGLVSNVVKQLINGFVEARSRLEQQWSRGEKASTEDLRVALKRYREFFDRLLAV